jgi:hypothetical protein
VYRTVAALLPNAAPPTVPKIVADRFLDALKPRSACSCFSALLFNKLPRGGVAYDGVPFCLPACRTTGPTGTMASHPLACRRASWTPCDQSSRVRRQCSLNNTVGQVAACCVGVGCVPCLDRPSPRPPPPVVIAQATPRPEPPSAPRLHPAIPFLPLPPSHESCWLRGR